MPFSCEGKMAVVQASTKLDASPEKVWDQLLEYRTLEYLMRGLIGFSGELPARMRLGDRLVLRLWFFHLIPAWKHRVAIVQLDGETRTITSHEHGGILRRWDHQMRVLASADRRAIYSDRVEIEAGLFTPLVWLWAQIQYRYRHARWLRLAREL
jgi:hypothetical protein